MWANVHQRCDEPRQPLESFRLAQLLSNGVAVLSERSDADDERRYAGLVEFCNLTALPACHERVLEREVRGGVQARRAARAREFARRFGAAAVFDGCERAFTLGLT